LFIPELIRKCVAFVAFNCAEGPRLAGTAFFVGIDIPNTRVHKTYAITARHVIEAIRQRSVDQKIFFRTNLRKGSTDYFFSKISDWRFHPTNDIIDVAALPMKMPEEIDHLAYPMSQSVSPEIIEVEQIGAGTEVFLVGLFSRHFGLKRNIPIIRVGNIAAMPEEPIEFQESKSVEAYLIETRSLGGLSGSPVFAHLGNVRIRDGKPQFAIGGAVLYLLGLVRGHWEKPIFDEVLTEKFKVMEERVNMGIAVVVPVKQIQEVLNQPEFLRERKQIEEELASRVAADTSNNSEIK